MLNAMGSSHVLKLKAYSYLRISTGAQNAGDGIRRQMDASARYAAENDYDLVEEIRDVGVSGFHGRNAKEGALGDFLAAIYDGVVASGSVLIVESLDRLSRDGATKAFSQFAGILSKGITIVTLLDGQVYTESSVNSNPGQLFTSLGIMIRANEESATKSKRLKAAWHKKRADISGKKLTSRAPAWLEMNNDRTGFLVRPEAAVSVQKIFDLCVNGMGIYTIARYLNGNLDRYPTIARAARWNNSYVSKILHNRAVIGVFQPSKMVDRRRTPIGDAIGKYYPPIVTEVKFYLAQSSLKQRRIGSAGRKGETHSNLFTNLVRCGSCDGSMIFRNKGRPPKGQKYLRCQNAILNNGCNKPAWRYTEFEGAFYKFVQEVSFAEIFDTGKREQVASLEDRRSAGVEKLAELKLTYDIVIDRLTEGKLSDVVLASLNERAIKTSDKIAGHKAEIEALGIQIVDEQASNVRADQADFLAEYHRLTMDMPPAEIASVRYQLHGLLVKSISKILVFNGSMLYPWEASTEISEKLRRELEGKGIAGDARLEEFFASEHGQRVHEHSDRYFLVRFKNGAVRTVRPYFDHSMVLVSERTAALSSLGQG
jgi:DNA invertase Pin-like site-specific DNA recombinase